MQISVRRAGPFGFMAGGVFALGLGAGLLPLVEPACRPIGVVTIVLGTVLALVILRRRRHGPLVPSIAPNRPAPEE